MVLRARKEENQQDGGKSQEGSWGGGTQKIMHKMQKKN